MESLFLDATNKHPEVKLDAKEGLVSFSGRSITENAKKFYQPIIEWIDDFFNQTDLSLTVNLEFEYVNSSSVVWILKLLKRVERESIKGRTVAINWFYDDEDIYDAGEDIMSIFNAPFNLINVADS